PPTPPLFPYTTLFRSACTADGVGRVPGAQPRPHTAEEAFGAQEVEPDPSPGEIDEASDLSRLGCERFAGARDRRVVALEDVVHGDRKSTRLNSSHGSI